MTPFEATLMPTPVGWALVFACLGCLVVRPRWLLPLLVIAAALHLPAALLVQFAPGHATLGVPPWLLVGGACCLQWLREAIPRGAPSDDHGGSAAAGAGSDARGWAIFLFAAAASGAVLPHVFAGLPVFWLGNTLGFDEPLSPLRWSITNGAQMVNACLLALLFLYVGREARHPGVARRLMAGFVLAFALSLMLGLAQRAMIRHLIEPWFWFTDSLNPGYTYGTGYFIDIPRAPWPFSEPSYASVWYSALALGGLALLLFRGRPWLGATCVVLGLAGMTNALGMTGFAALLVTGAALLALRLSLLFRKDASENDKRLRRTLMSAALTVLAGFAVLLATSPGTRHVAQRSALALEEKADRELNVDNGRAYRLRSNLHAAKLVGATWGLGVGLGSNRASSYLAGVASNLGIVGIAAFLALLARHLRRLVRLAPGASTTFVLAGSFATFTGISMGIPDFAWPGWWIWILAGVALVRAPVAGAGAVA